MHVDLCVYGLGHDTTLPLLGRARMDPDRLGVTRVRMGVYVCCVVFGPHRHVDIVRLASPGIATSTAYRTPILANLPTNVRLRRIVYRHTHRTHHTSLQRNDADTISTAVAITKSHLNIPCSVSVSATKRCMLCHFGDLDNGNSS